MSDFLVLRSLQTACQEIEQCNGDMGSCLHNRANLSQFYISSSLNDTKTKSVHRKHTRVYRKQKNINYRKKFHRKIHRHSTRVLSLQPAIILLPPFENDIQEKNVSTLNPFIINILAGMKNSTSIDNFDFFPLSSERKQNPLNKHFPSLIQLNELKPNEINTQNSSMTSVTELVKNPIIVPPSDLNTFPEPEPTTVNAPFSNINVESTSLNEIQPVNTPPPPFQYLLPPLQEEGNNAVDLEQLEKPNNFQFSNGSATETGTPFHDHELPISTLPIRETVSKTESRQTIIAYDDYSLSTIETTVLPILNNTKLANEKNALSSFNNTLLSPEIASLGMKIVTSRKGLEMVKELTSLSKSELLNDHQHYEGSQSLLETAETGDIRLHTYNQILSVEDAKDLDKDMYKTLKTSHKLLEICNLNHGYVADPSSGCQVFYICLGSGAGEPMMCPNGTLFNQEVLVCDWWYNVECSG